MPLNVHACFTNLQCKVANNMVEHHEQSLWQRFAKNDAKTVWLLSLTQEALESLLDSVMIIFGV